MKASVFSDAIESSAKVFGRKAVNVVFEGDEARTDGDTIYLPSLPASADVTVDQADVIRGYRDHESFHVRCTDTSKPTLEKLKQAETASPHLGQLIQYCEDIRVENAGIQEYPGAKSTLTATNTFAAKMLLTQLEGRGDPAEVLQSLPKDALLRMMLQAIGRNKIGVGSDGVFEQICNHVKAADPTLYELADRFSTRMAELPTGYKNGTLNETASRKGTAAAFDLASEIKDAYEVYEQTPPPPPPQPQPSDKDDEKKDKDKGDGKGNPSGGDGDGEDGDEDGGDQGSGDSESDEDGDGDKSDSDGDSGDGDEGDEGDESDGDGGQGDDESDGDGSGGGGGDSDGDGDDGDGEQSGQGGDGHSDGGSSGNAPANGSGMNGIAPSDPKDFALDDVMKSALNGVMKDMADRSDIKVGGKVNKSYRVYSNQFSQVVPISDLIFASTEASTEHDKDAARAQAVNTINKIDKEVSGKKAMIRRLLELELQARSDRKWESGFKSGRLQSVRLVQAIQGRETVYQRRENGKDMDTLLYISIDGSESMRLGRTYPSAALAYALSDALERTGCDIIVSVWSNRSVTATQSTSSKYTQSKLNSALKGIGLDMFGRSSCSDSAEKMRDFVSFGLLTRGMVKAKRQRTSDPSTRMNFGFAAHYIRGSTPTYQAVFEDLRDMAKEQHSKKIYLHITDGEPDYLHSDKFTSEGLMKEAHAYAAAVKVHMIGVGIANCKVSHLFPDNVEVDSSDAYEPVIRKLAKLIAKEAGHAAGFKRAA